MNQLASLSLPSLPALVAAAGDRAGVRFFEFFAGQIRNPRHRSRHRRLHRNQRFGDNTSRLLHSPSLESALFTVSIAMLFLTI
jgi:hypothetical protein